MQSFAARSLMVVLVCAGLSPVVPVGVESASGQIIVRSSGGRGGTTLITARSVDDYAKLLQLSAEQLETVKTLHEGYRAAWKVADDERDAKQEAAQEKMQDGDFDAMNKSIMETMDAFAEKTTALEKQFLDDTKAILTAEQVDRWPAVERHRRRDTRLRTPAYSGSNVDLIRVADRVVAEPVSAELKQLLQDYEMAIDRQLVEGTNRTQAIPKPEGNGAFDPKHQEALMKAIGENGRALRDLNRDYAKRLAGLMDDETRAKFEAEVAKRSFPQVYEAAHIEDCLAAASGFEDLDAGAKETISQLKQQWSRDAVALNRSWSDAIAKAEEEAGGSMPLQMQQWNGGGPNKEVKAARDARRELEKRLRSRLDEVLATAQEDRLPAKRKGESNPFGGVQVRIGNGPGDDEE